MCGIAGIYQRNGKAINTSIVTKMGLTMTHRGPDNFGSSHTKKIAMTHNRLSLLDLSDAANQPFVNERYMLAYNGEVYNFRQIRERLEREYNIEFRTTSDTEVLFFSLIHDGIDKCLQQIKGMFAFAFYDETEDRLFLARDRVGIKPLYYHQSGDGVYWASEIKALAKSLDLRPHPVRTLFAANNTGEKSPEYTLFKGVRSIRPGCYLDIDSKGEPRNTVYYDVLDDIDQDYYRELDGQPTARVLSTFEKIFTESVDSTLMSDVPVGAFVSGGIDSSFISSVASILNADVKLFTANVVGKYSEFSDVELLSKYLKKEIFEYKFEPEMMLRDWVDVTYFYDGPIVIHVNSIPLAGVARLARNSGVKAVLTGEGADELFLGYPALLTRRYESIASFPIKAVKSLYKMSPKLYRYLFPESQSPLPFLNQLIQGFEVPRLREKAEEKLQFLNNGRMNEQYLTINMIREHLVTLLHRNDRMGMMSSIEARFPFLDEEIVKFAVNLPSRFKIGRSRRFHNYKHPFLIDKWILRKTAERYLPTELVNKRKNGFPMFGHKFLKIKKGFFENGWLEETLGLRVGVQDYLLSSQDPYFVAKLASVEIFGRIFDQGQSRENVKSHVLAHAEILPG